MASDKVIRRYIADYPNSFHFIMSPTDNHPDHAAAGIALRRLKAEGREAGQANVTRRCAEWSRCH
jgi:LmbE family N-acetylglucosaminyl deacetylase